MHKRAGMRNTCVVEIQNQAKLINNIKGKPVEVILPYEIYRELLELQTTMEIYNSEATQTSIKKSKNHIKRGKITSFSNLNRAFKWLDKQ